MRKQAFVRIFAGTGLILLIPLIAMQFSDDVGWDIFDFIVMGTLLLGSGILYVLITSRLRQKYRPVIAVIVIGSVLLIWAELAVGIVGSPFAGS